MGLVQEVEGMKPGQAHHLLGASEAEHAPNVPLEDARSDEGEVIGPRHSDVFDERSANRVALRGALRALFFQVHAVGRIHVLDAATENKTFDAYDTADGENVSHPMQLETNRARHAIHRRGASARGELARLVPKPGVGAMKHLVSSSSNHSTSFRENAVLQNAIATSYGGSADPVMATTNCGAGVLFCTYEGLSCEIRLKVRDFDPVPLSESLVFSVSVTT